jgi:hypothetical protein
MYRFIMVCRSADANALNQRFKTLIDRAGGEKTFTVGLGLTAGGAKTKYWCGSQLPEDKIDALKTILSEFPSATCRVWSQRGGGKPVNEAFGARVKAGKKSPRDVALENSVVPV